MGSRQPFLAQDSFFDDPERANSMQGNGNNLHLIVSNEAFEYVDEDDYDDACWSCCTPWRILVGLGLFALFGLMAVTWPDTTYAEKSCDDVDMGFSCSTSISHSWGQYSAYFSVPSEISAEVPDACTITFAQVLSRHGGRYPTTTKSQTYAHLITRLKSSITHYPTAFLFLRHYKYTLASEALTPFGQSQMTNSGTKFYHRYKALANTTNPFYRTASGSRVVESALKFAHGFSAAKFADGKRSNAIVEPQQMVIIDEAGNNTLSHGTCDAFEDDRAEWSDSAEAVWANIFVPPITRRLNAALTGANLSTIDTINLMDLCPFETIASVTGALSPICNIFTPLEWTQYDYYQTLNKYYGFHQGAPLGPTQGVGFVNELIARLTGPPVHDHTNTNTTLDADPKTFPLGRTLYADFSHDNDMVSIFAALGLWNVSVTAPLNKTEWRSAGELGGWSASWSVPFAGRAYIEKLVCGRRGLGLGNATGLLQRDEEEDWEAKAAAAARDEGEDGRTQKEMVRILVNDRVVPLLECGGGDEYAGLGMCELNKWVESLAFARSGGRWDECFRKEKAI